MVTHQGEEFVAEQLESMLAQTRPLDGIVIVDDGSTDGTFAVVSKTLEASSVDWKWIPATRPRPALNLFQRIADNFSQGIDAARADIVVLADQDDRWHPDRVEVQVDALLTNPELAMVAHNMALVDSTGALLNSTMQDSFPTLLDWSSASSHARLRYVMRNPVATGAASAIRPRRLPGGVWVPPGWLHDRWYSLAAASNDALFVSQQSVIDYRVHDKQVVGVTGATTRSSLPAWLLNKSREPALAVRKLWHESRLGLHSNAGWRSPLVFPRSLGVLSQTPAGSWRPANR